MNEELKDDLIVGVIWGLIGGLTWGLISGLIGGLSSGLSSGLIGGLIWGLTCGLTITFTTQLIALITSNPNFVMFDLIISGIIILVIEIIGWYYFYKLKGKELEDE